MKSALHPLRALTSAALIVLALQVSALAAAPVSYPMEYPSATTSPVPAALRDAIETTLARDPDAVWLEQEVIASDGQSGDLFGFRVLVSGNSAFVSSPAPLNRPGKVYVFTDASGT